MTDNNKDMTNDQLAFLIWWLFFLYVCCIRNNNNINNNNEPKIIYITKDIENQTPTKLV